MIELEFYIKQINSVVKNVLESRFVGCYIHGSVAEGTFRWDRSDIDVLVIMDGHLNMNEKSALLNEILTLDEKGPLKGIEMSILNRSDINDSTPPFPFEFHSSRDWLKHIKSSGQNKYPDYLEHLLDRDLAGHMFNLHHHHIVVEGPPADTVFPEVTEDDFFKSIDYDEQGAPIDVIDTVMNMCRFDHYLNTGEVVSKHTGLLSALGRYTRYNEFLSEIESHYRKNEKYIPGHLHDDAVDFRHFMISKRDI